MPQGQARSIQMQMLARHPPEDAGIQLWMPGINW
jgi:hypothetical protein